MPNSRPRIEFDEDGVCNACRNAEQKNSIDWDGRRREFVKLVEPYRSRNGSYDCIVPWSGGKDSSAIAWHLKFEFGLNPLLVTFSPLIPNEVGAHNREEMLRAGFDHLMVRPNQHVARHLARRFFRERGNPKVHWDAGVNAVPVQVAVNYNIPLVFYAEHGESEYGGRLLSEEHRKIRDFTEVLEHQIGDDPHNWVDEEVLQRDLQPYLYPAARDAQRIGLKALYFAYFFRWSMFENYNYIKSKIDFHVAAQGRTDGTFTNFDSLDDKIDDVYYYLQFIKFGFGRANRDACRMINNGHMSRDEGLALTRKYDGEFPATHFSEVLEYLGISSDEFHHIINMHRNDEIWMMSGNEWTLRNPVK
jgi:N-acetyl sugar amidotransferase